MLIQTKNNLPVIIRKLSPDDIDNLVSYLHQLSTETRKRFGPHEFDRKTVLDFYESSGIHTGYIGLDAETNGIIAYSIIRKGYLEHDSSRLRYCGLIPDAETDCTFAPSVADSWQSLGVGNSLFRFILDELRSKGIKRIILWGGVQCNNEKAVNFYLKHGFRILGQFEYNGWNYDMVLDSI
ncbi:MAG: GNAT family N-acetyltransferase [Bacteroidota bacterium]